ncbi:acetyl-CoA acetyltransferase [Rhodococcus sp. SC4]|nr:acetyl-CoA acetyltransferase [Rhodococcus sp. SC4]
MRDAVIVEALRTPVGKRNGGLAGVHPADLSAVVLRALVTRTGIDPADVDDVVWGCVSQIGEQTFDIARTAVLSAGWPESVPGTTVDRQCGSSQQAVHFAAAGVISGQYDLAVAGGVESMSRIPMMSAISNESNPLGADYAARYGADFPSQGLGAEEIAAKWGLSRERMDSFALRSHALAQQAVERGLFEQQIEAVTTADGAVVTRDEGIRPDGTLESLGRLKPAFRQDGVVTAGNASQISDGSAALLITTSENAKALGLTPLARIHTAVVAGSDPNIMLTGPIPATHKALERSGIKLSEIGVFEVNEAFASVPLAWMAEFDVPVTAVNPNGGAIALGHPLGGSGARIMTTLAHHMCETGTRFGLQTMCEGGGQANATILELL